MLHLDDECIQFARQVLHGVGETSPLFVLDVLVVKTVDVRHRGGESHPIGEVARNEIRHGLTQPSVLIAQSRDEGSQHLQSFQSRIEDLLLDRHVTHQCVLQALPGLVEIALLRHQLAKEAIDALMLLVQKAQGKRLRHAASYFRPKKGDWTFSAPS